MERKVTFKNIVGYASINFLGSGAQALISAWLMFFYTTVCGISPAMAGLIFTLARIVDAVANPIVGFISDNFGRTKLGRKFGRRKFFILIGAPLVTIVFPLLWVQGKTFTYYLIVNLIFEFIFTIVIVTAITLPAEMTKKSIERTKLIGAKQYCGTIASTIATFIPGVMFAKYGENSPAAFFKIGIIYGVITGLSLLVVYFFTFERDPKEIVYNDEIGSIGTIFKKLFMDVISCMKIKAFRIHSIMMALGSIYKQLVIGIFTYFAIFVLNMDSIATSNILSFTTLVSSVSLAIFIYLSYKVGGPKTFRISSYIAFVSIIGYAALIMMNKNGGGNIVLLLTIFALISTVGRAGIDYIPTYQLPFMSDIDEAVTGQRREGIYTGVNSFFSKIATAVQGAVLGMGLAMFGFQSGATTQPQSAIIGIIIVALVFPVVLLGISSIASLQLKLTKENHLILVNEVQRLKEGGRMEDATQEAKDVFKQLTGFEYEECWGNNDVVYTDQPKVKLNKFLKNS